MNPLLTVATGEFRLQTRRFAFWFFAALFVVVGSFYFTRFMAVSAGEDSLTQGVKLARNCAYSLSIIAMALAIVFCHFTAALSIDPVLRDRRIGLLPMVLSSPLSERDYILGKFLGVAVAALAAPLFFVLTAGIAQFIPNSAVGLMPPNLTGYLVAYVEFVLPFTLLVAATSFALATRSGNTKLVYAVVTLFMMSYLIGLSAVESIERRWVAYLDPTGLLWLAEVAGKGKSNAEQNALGWMGDAWFLANRLVVLLVALGAVALVARGFARQASMAGSAPRRRKAPSAAAGPAPAGGAVSPLRPLAAEVRLDTGAIRQFARVSAAELRLLLNERALFFLAPLLVLVLLTNFGSTSGPFESPMIPITSQLVRDSYGLLLLFLFGTTVFFAGESAFRERETNVSEMLHTCPVPEIAIVGGKLVANLAISVVFLAVAVATISVYGTLKGGGPVDPRAFGAYFGILVAPTLILMTTLSLAVASAARAKQAAYAVLLGLAGILVWAFIRGHRHWLYNLPALSLTTYSDIVGFGPFLRPLLVQRVYVLALGVFFLFAAAGLYPRAAGRSGGSWIASWKRRGVLVPAAAALLVALGLGLRIHLWVEDGIGSLANERMAVRYEKDYKGRLENIPQPELAGVDLDVDLFPSRSAFTIAGSYALKNAGSAPIESVHVTVNPRLLSKGEMTLAGRTPDRFEAALATFALAEPLQPGAEIPLAFHWSGRVPDGLPRHSGGMQTWIQPGATFLHSFDSAALAWLPQVGYQATVEIGSDRTRRKHKLGKRESLPESDGAGMTPGFSKQTWAFPYRAKIRVPEGERVLSAGSLVAERDAGGGRREFEYASDGPIFFFPIMAGCWEEAREGPTAVYHDPRHTQNTAKILDALVRSRALYSEVFSPFPYEQLRIAEFPRHGTFAMGYPTLIPFAESIGFLTKDPKNLPNLNVYVTAHEVAHQWWGTVVWPAHAKGSAVLTEGLSNYASLLAAERFEGDAKRRRLFLQYEDRYLRQRDPNEERPMMLVDGDRRGDDAIMYNRGGIVFYMLHRMLGEERMLAVIREYVRRYSFQPDHPTMTDVMALFREMAPETSGFLSEFVEGKAIPNPGLSSAACESLPDGRWRVTFEVANRGQGDLDLVVEAHEGKRADQEKLERKGAAADSGKAAAGAHGASEESAPATIGAAARTSVALRGTGPVSGEVICAFRPDEIEIDPEGTVLLQERLKGRRDL